MKNAIAVFLAVVFVAACAGLGIWGTDRLIALVRPAEEGGQEGPGAVRVTVARPETTEIRDTFGALGTIRACARSICARSSRAGWRRSPSPPASGWRRAT